MIDITEILLKFETVEKQQKLQLLFIQSAI